MKKKISVLVNGTFHAIELAKYLYKKKQLGLLIICYPKYKIRENIFDKKKIKTFGIIYILQYFFSKIDPNKKNIINFLIINLFDYFASILINKNNTDVLICWASICSLTIKKCKKMGIKTILIRGSTHIDYQIGLLEKEYLKFNKFFPKHNYLLLNKEKKEYDLCDFIEVPSNFCKKTFIDNHFNKKKIYVIPRSIDTNIFQVKRTFNKKPKNIIFVGNTIFRKGLIYLINSLGNLDFDFKLTIVGSINKNILFSLCKDISKYKINFTGHLNQQDLIKEYSKADIFCLPTLEEGMSNVILQAMSCSLPVIVTNISGGEDIIENNFDGIIIKPRNSNQIANSINSLYFDDNLRAKISTNSRKKIIKFFQRNFIYNRAVNLYSNL